jgi:hypothetical protein
MSVTANIVPQWRGNVAIHIVMGGQPALIEGYRGVLTVFIPRRRTLTAKEDIREVESTILKVEGDEQV